MQIVLLGLVLEFRRAIAARAEGPSFADAQLSQSAGVFRKETVEVDQVQRRFVGLGIKIHNDVVRRQVAMDHAGSLQVHKPADQVLRAELPHLVIKPCSTVHDVQLQFEPRLPGNGLSH